MMHVMRADARHCMDCGGRKTSWVFLFSASDDPANIQCGALRVCNDAVVALRLGVGTPARDDAVTHAESLGATAVMRAGDVQRLSAGTGICHADGTTRDLSAHVSLIWRSPDTSRVPPSAAQPRCAGTMWTHRLVPVASVHGPLHVVTFHTAATVSLGSLEARRRMKYETNGTRREVASRTEGGPWTARGAGCPLHRPTADSGGPYREQRPCRPAAARPLPSTTSAP